MLPIVSRRALLAQVAGALLVLALASEASAQTWKLGVGMVPNPGGGVRVVQVFMGSPAEALGLRPGHVILAVDGRLMSSPYEVRDYIMDPDRLSVVLLVQEGPYYYEMQASFEVVAASVLPGGRYVAPMKKVKPGSVYKKRVPAPRR